jgi:hypothetical protein
MELFTPEMIQDMLRTLGGEGMHKGVLPMGILDELLAGGLR